MNIYEKLLTAQINLKAPKGQYNNFGKYKYRSCEDILEALKPVLNKLNLTMFITDEIVEVNSRNYVKATVHLINNEKLGEAIQVSALAREEETKKGMDGSQITGASSSYARKYALNGLFAIDDTKDSDSTSTNTNDNKKQGDDESRKVEAINAIKGKIDTEDKLKWLKETLKEEFKKEKIEDLDLEQLKRLWGRVK